ncbi:hypothetical protein BTA51_04785 [Hahella sp. CCB-MM4]|uniref:hypothetical protein n=1 Tax=Hahella sp. (strain CCB-MM4) TaxID=1926491 RepID=UPI000B9B27A3|nr:hypothetical protein [Hahella sp. CCB-MM4]OZG74331.1 hypothetical protein BTA51_04785 [Hahella sp. CCB-MM4]
MARSLTSNEVALAKNLFGISVDYSAVKIHFQKAVFFQPSNSGMTPNGNIYVDGKVVADYGISNSVDEKAFFLHEMTHVWQKQNRVLNPILSAIGNSLLHFGDYGKAYFYRLDSKWDLLDYRMEQQAQILEDYSRVVFFNVNPRRSGPNQFFLQNSGLTHSARLKLYKDVLKNFLLNPSYVKTYQKSYSKPNLK